MGVLPFLIGAALAAVTQAGCVPGILALTAGGGSVRLTFDTAEDGGGEDSFRILLYGGETTLDCSVDLDGDALATDDVITQANASATAFRNDDCSVIRRVCCTKTYDETCALCVHEYIQLREDRHYCAKMYSLQPTRHLHTATVFLARDAVEGGVVVESISSGGSRRLWWAFSVVLALVTVTALYVVYRHRRRPPRGVDDPDPETSDDFSKRNGAQCSSSSGPILVLYHYDDARHFECVRGLANALRRFLDRTVVLDRGRGGLRETVVEEGAAGWVSRMLEACDAVVFVSSEGAFERIRRHRLRTDAEATPPEDTFLFGWRAAVADPGLGQNHARIFNVRFEYTDCVHSTPDIARGRSFRLPRDFAELASRLLGGAEDARRRTDALRREIADSPSFAAFAERLRPDDEDEDVRWIRPGL